MLVHVGRPYRLVRLLSPFRLSGILTHLMVLLAVLLHDLAFCRTDGQTRQVHRVGTHVGDLPRFIESLRHHHGLPHGEAQLARCFLLQGGSCERGGRCFLCRSRIDLIDGERGSFQFLQQSQCLLFGFESLVILRLDLVQLSLILFREDGHDAVRGFRLELLDLPFPLHDQSHRDRLYPSRGERRFNLSPEHGRQLEAHDTIQHPSRLLRVHQVLIDGARILYRFLNGIFGDLMKNNALGILFFQIQRIEKMPRNGFPLPVLVRSQPYRIGLFSSRLQFGHHLLLIGRNLVDRCEVVFNIDAKIFFLQVADMPVAGHDMKILSKKFFNGLCLRGRLDDNQVLFHSDALSFIQFGIIAFAVPILLQNSAE